jgi:WhiB family transcriptional regulator, redox-sensing transcriptional regulator
MTFAIPGLRVREWPPGVRGTDEEQSLTCSDGVCHMRHGGRGLGAAGAGLDPRGADTASARLGRGAQARRVDGRRRQVGVFPDGFVGSLRNLSWQKKGNCRDAPTYLFFPGRRDRVLLDAAKAICADCPVKRQCLQYGLDTGSAGVWGGLNELERQQLRGLRGGHGGVGTNEISSASA